MTAFSFADLFKPHLHISSYGFRAGKTHYWRAETGSLGVVTLYPYEVLRYTKRCTVIAASWTLRGLKFINNEHVKRYAYPTQEEALQSLRCRKLRQIAILRAQLDGAKEALADVEQILQGREHL